MTRDAAWTARQHAEVDRNYDAFVALLPGLLATRRGQYAVMRDGAVVDYFEKVGDASHAGYERFADGHFSIQQVTDEPIDLGFFSHVAFACPTRGARPSISPPAEIDDPDTTRSSRA